MELFVEIFCSDMEREVNSVSTIMSRNPPEHCSSEPRTKPTKLHQELCKTPVNTNCSGASCSMNSASRNE